MIRERLNISRSTAVFRGPVTEHRTTAYRAGPAVFFIQGHHADRPTVRTLYVGRLSIVVGAHAAVEAGAFEVRDHGHGVRDVWIRSRYPAIHVAWLTGKLDS